MLCKSFVVRVRNEVHKFTVKLHRIVSYEFVKGIYSLLHFEYCPQRSGRKMCAFRSLLLTAISLLISTRIDFAAASHYRCQLPPYFTLGGVNQTGRADFYQSQMTVTVPDYGYSILTYQGSNTITFGLSGISVNFDGNVVYYGKDNKQMPLTRITQAFNDRISGVAQRIQMNYADSSITDCHLYLLPVVADRLSVSQKIAGEIRRLAEECIQPQICSQIGRMGAQYKMGQPSQSGLVQLPGLAGRMNYHGSFSGQTSFQIALNTLVDRGLAYLVTGLKVTNRRKINLPKIDTHFTEGKIFKTKNHFEGLNGTLSDLTDLVRVSPPTVSHEGMRFIISSKFAINSAKLHYNYKFKHGSRVSTGPMSAEFRPVDLEASFVADYSRVPCMASVQQIKVTGFGKVTQSFVGSSESKTLRARNWFDAKTLSDIGKTLEDQLQYAVQSGNTGLWAFNCEIYRP